MHIQFTVFETFLKKIIFITFGPHCEACWILVPQPGIKSMPLAFEVQRLKSLKHWTTKEVPRLLLFK